eukprot:6091218-Pleurochrysis_carterae.AAC.4
MYTSKLPDGQRPTKCCARAVRTACDARFMCEVGTDLAQALKTALATVLRDAAQTKPLALRFVAFDLHAHTKST